MSFSVDPYLARRGEPNKCWDLVREAWLEITGHDIGDRTPRRPTMREMIERFDREEREFVRLPEPATPSIVLMRRARLIPHVGLFWLGRVLHMTEVGVHYERLADATRGFDQIGFYACSTSS